MLHGILNYSRESLWTDPFLFLIDRNDTSVGKADRSRTAADRKRKATTHHSIIGLWKFVHLYIIRAVCSIIIDVTFPVGIRNQKAVAFETPCRITEKANAETAFLRRGIGVLAGNKSSMRGIHLLGKNHIDRISKKRVAGSDCNAGLRNRRSGRPI